MEKLFELPLNERISLAKKEIVKDGKFPRAVTSEKLIGFGIATKLDQAEFCNSLINEPDNNYARILVVSRNPDEKSSPVRWFARGRDNSLGETFVPPHIEPEESKFEVFELVKGEAVLAIYKEDKIDSDIKFINLKPHDPQVILPGQIHTVLCRSANVEVVEFKVISETKISPSFAREMNLVTDNNLEQSGPHVDEYLKEMHRRADLSFLC